MITVTRTLAALPQRAVTRDEKNAAIGCRAVRLGFVRRKDGSYERSRNV